MVKMRKVLDKGYTTRNKVNLTMIYYANRRVFFENLQSLKILPVDTIKKLNNHIRRRKKKKQKHTRTLYY